VCKPQHFFSVPNPSNTLTGVAIFHPQKKSDGFDPPNFKPPKGSSELWRFFPNLQLEGMSKHTKNAKFNFPQKIRSHVKPNKKKRVGRSHFGESLHPGVSITEIFHSCSSLFCLKLQAKRIFLWGLM